MSGGPDNVAITRHCIKLSVCLLLFSFATQFNDSRNYRCRYHSIALQYPQLSVQNKISYCKLWLGQILTTVGFLFEWGQQ